MYRSLTPPASTKARSVLRKARAPATTSSMIQLTWRSARPARSTLRILVINECRSLIPPVSTKPRSVPLAARVRATTSSIYHMGVAVGATGTIYVADDSNQRVQVFNSSGIYQSTIGTTGSRGSGNNQLTFPDGVAVSPTGMVYVADTGNNRIVRYFDPNSWASGTNTFTDPTVGPTSVNVGPGQDPGHLADADFRDGLGGGGGD